MQELTPENAIKALYQKDEERVLAIALDGSFISDNPEIVRGGLLIKLSLEQEMPELAKTLSKKGYGVPASILLDAAKDQKEQLIYRVLENGFYSQECLELNVWYLCQQGFYEPAGYIIHKHSHLKDLLMGAPLSPQALHKLITNMILCESALTQAISLSADEIASSILKVCPSAISLDMIDNALEHNCLQFLKRVWTGNTKHDDIKSTKSISKTSNIWAAISSKSPEHAFKLASVLEHYLKIGDIQHAHEVLEWPDALEENGVLLLLITYKHEELAKRAIVRSAQTLSSDNFLAAFNSQLYELCVDLLQFKESRSVLQDAKVQESLISLLESGTTCLPAMEMLSLVTDRSWKVELTKELCSTLSTFAKKRDEIVLCPGPILFCVLANEFLTRLSTISLQHSNRCLSTAEIFNELGIKIEDSIKDENELRYFFHQQDSRGRSVLTILSKNRMYNMLENDEVGTIITKMWIGSKKNYGILGASTIVNSFHSPSGAEEAMQFARPMIETKPYMFHYEQWIESCSLRFVGQAISTFALVVIYQMVIYTAISADSFQNVAANQTSMIYLRIAQIWVSGIMVEMLLLFIFGKKTGRGFDFNNWRVLDFVMFGVMITLMLELHERFIGPDKTIDGDPVMFNAGLHSVMMIIIWLRFMSVLITSKRFGPFLRMIYLMIGKVVNFFVIFLCLGICSAAVFTALFNESSEMFINFSYSIRTLYSASLASFDMTNFNDNVALGGVLLGIFILMANVMLLNLLIALLSNVYSDLIIRVDSEHRAVVVSSYNRFNWDRRYGLLIFLPSPLTILSLLSSPFVLYTKNAAYWNNLICKVLYILYAIPQFALFIVGSLLYLPLLYFKGFAIYGRRSRTIVSSEAQVPDITVFSTWRSLSWTFIGFPWLMYAFFRDCGSFWKLIYKSLDFVQDETEASKVQQMVTKDFIVDVVSTLRDTSEEEMSVAQFVSAWQTHDNKREEKLTPEQASERETLAFEYFSQFANSNSDSTIKIERMKRLLPDKENGYFSEDFINKAKHINVPWMAKAVKKYQQKVGSVSLAAINLQKKNTDLALDIKQVERLEKSVKQLEDKYVEILNVGIAIRSEIEEQFKVINEINNSQELKS